MALAISQSEAEEQEKAKKKLANQYRMQTQSAQKKEEKVMPGNAQLFILCVVTKVVNSSR